MKKLYVLVLIILFLIALAANLFAQSPAGALPVILVEVNATPTTNNQVAICWTTTQQINTDCFNVEKSNDGVSWRCIAVVKAGVNTAKPVSYTTLDPFPLKGSNFYRILLKNLNGESGYTETKHVRMNALGKTTIYPNPSSGIIHIALSETPPADWYLSLMDSFGQVIRQKKYNRNTTTASLPVDSYPNGSYILQITSGNDSQNKKLLINHN